MRAAQPAAVMQGGGVTRATGGDGVGAGGVGGEAAVDSLSLKQRSKQTATAEAASDACEGVDIDWD